MFDSTYLLASDDPEFETFQELADKGLIDLRVVGGVGCERFAEQAFDEADRIVKDLTDGRCWVQKCTLREHEANSATVELADTPKMRFLEDVQ